MAEGALSDKNRPWRVSEWLNDTSEARGVSRNGPAGAYIARNSDVGESGVDTLKGRVLQPPITRQGRERPRALPPRPLENEFRQCKPGRRGHRAGRAAAES